MKTWKELTLDEVDIIVPPCRGAHHTQCEVMVFTKENFIFDVTHRVDQLGCRLRGASQFSETAIKFLAALKKTNQTNISYFICFSVSRVYTPKLSRLVWGTLRFDSIRSVSIRTTRSQDPWNNDTWTFLVLKSWQQTSVDSYEARYDSTRWAKIDFWHHESTTGETICVDSIQSSRIDNIFNLPCVVHQKSRSVKQWYMNLAHS